MVDSTAAHRRTASDGNRGDGDGVQPIMEKSYGRCPKCGGVLWAVRRRSKASDHGDGATTSVALCTTLGCGHAEGDLTWAMPRPGSRRIT
jgi:hypothetical protein